MKGPRLKTMGPRLKPIDTQRLKAPPKFTEDFYGSAEWKAVRAQVLQRDHYRCVKCGRRDGRMYVDHIVERKDGGADFDPANLETLDAACHAKKTHQAAVNRGAHRYTTG